MSSYPWTIASKTPCPFVGNLPPFPPEHSNISDPLTTVSSPHTHHDFNHQPIHVPTESSQVAQKETSTPLPPQQNPGPIHPYASVYDYVSVPTPPNNHNHVSGHQPIHNPPATSEVDQKETFNSSSPPHPIQRDTDSHAPNKEDNSPPSSNPIVTSHNISALKETVLLPSGVPTEEKTKAMDGNTSSQSSVNYLFEERSRPDIPSSQPPAKRSERPEDATLPRIPRKHIPLP